MMEYSFYHKDTGLIHPQHFMTDDFKRPHVLLNNTPPDHIAIDGHHDHLSRRVDLSADLVPFEYFGEGCKQTKMLPPVVDYQPPAPDEHHEWNPETKRWQLPEAVQAQLKARWEAERQIGRLEAQAISPLCELALGLPGAADKVKEIYGQIQALRARL